MPDKPVLTRRLTLNEVADWFQVTDRTVRRWVKDGYLRAERIRGTVRFSADDVRGAARRSASAGGT